MLQGAAVPRKSLRLNRARRPPFVSREPLRFIDSRAGRPLQNRYSDAGGNRGVGEGMGSRLHGNDGRAPHPYPSGVTQRSPQAGIQGWERGWVPVSTGTTDARPTLIQAGLRKGLRRRESRGGRGAGFPSPRERRARAPPLSKWGYAKVSAGGNPGVGEEMGSRLHGNDGRAPHPCPSGVTQWSRAGGNSGVGEGMGSGWVPVSTGTTGARPTLIQVGLRKGLAQAGIRGGRGDGFPSPRERRTPPC